MQIRAEERAIFIKSPLYVWSEMRFQTRKFKHRLTDYLKRLNLV
ncbi:MULTISPECIES: hypothetical protein [Pantoea]|nr:hypothetical protein [Pantoea agglomerans]